jgi:hypothetical protein
MLEALKSSLEKKELVDAALKYLRGVKGHLVQQKKRDREKAAAALNGGLPPAPPKPRGPTNNPEKYVPYAPPSAPMGPGASATQLPNGPPQREVPSWYQGPEDAAPGRLGVPVHAQRTAAEQQRMQQIQAHGQLNEEHMENALRGFLGH